MSKSKLLFSALITFVLLSAPAAHAKVENMDAEFDQFNTSFITESGLEAGTVKMTQGPNGILFHLDLENIAPGPHGLHLHDIGDCTPYGSLEDKSKAFTRAGGHLNPENVEHGFLNENGKHAGDLPNIFVPENGELQLDIFAHNLTLEPKEGMINLKDENGSALMIHAGADNYVEPKTGHAGPRLACAEIK